MLTADLVRARKRTGQLVLVELGPKERAEALALATTYLELAAEHVGRSREDLEEAWSTVVPRPALCRIADGLRKLVDDRCVFEPLTETPPEVLRREVFHRAAECRKASSATAPFDRGAVLAEVAAPHGLTVDDLEHGLYADLRGAHRLRAVEPITPAALVEGYDLAQAQAVLLRAVRVVAEVGGASPSTYRALFAKLKFLRLLYAIQPLAEGGYRIEIDGPFSMFEAVTKYGLQLALCLPALQSCPRWSLRADVRWGKEREALVFALQGDRPTDAAPEPFALSAETESFVRAFRALASPWRVTAAKALLPLPGKGLGVPDLLFEHEVTKQKIYFEIMGYWSREAVWKRVDLIRHGLRETLLLAVSERLRVSEAVLPPDESGALYVYKGTMNPKTVRKKLDVLAEQVAALVSQEPAPDPLPRPHKTKRKTSSG